ncbi:MAG: TetR/AcrR family transcriptional regulator [Nocardioides sp.]|uniref:TetR/AcrR family transcriptional regulator n=1 Tax=Nocardioides sp. TaxID=35761 RepID=UPI0039E33572
MSTTTGAGRPRREEVGPAVLAITADLVSRHGLVGTTLDEIARRAGVAKTTVYRRWPSKGALAVDALAQVLGEPPVVTVPTEEGLHAAVSWLADRVRHPTVAALLSGLVAEAAHDAELRGRLRARIRDPFTSRLVRDWRLEADDVDRAFDIVVGALLHRRAMNGVITDLDDTIVTEVATRLVFGLRDG